MMMVAARRGLAMEVMPGNDVTFGNYLLAMDVRTCYNEKEPAGAFRLVSFASRVRSPPSGLSLFSYNSFGA